MVIAAATRSMLRIKPALAQLAGFHPRPSQGSTLVLQRPGSSALAGRLKNGRGS